MSDREPGQLARSAFMKAAQNKDLTLGQAWAEAEAAIYEDAAKVARSCFWSQVGGGRVVSRQASPDEVEAAIRAKIGGSHG